jgi:hypothetical protein
MPRTVLVLALLLCAPLPASAEPTRLMPGLGVVAFRPEGHPNLLLDYGRALDQYLSRYGMRGTRGVRADEKIRRQSRYWLNAVEKTRLDARRVWTAPRLSPEEKLERLVAIVQHRFPESDGVRAAHERLTHAELGRDGEGFARLSHRAHRRVGRSFERAWLLQGLLAEVGQRANVHNGELFDVMSRSRGVHSWIELDLDGQRRLVDPSSSQPLPETRLVSVRGQSRTTPRRVGIETLSGWLYLPDSAVTVP